MTDIYRIFNPDTEDEWLNVLEKYQKNTVIELIKIKSPEEAASIWLESTVNNNAPFGVGKPENNKKILDVLKTEIHKLLCGDSEYEEERSNLKKEINNGNNKTTIVSFVSAVIGAKIGLAATFIAPAVVIIFTMIAKVTLNTWCQL